MHHIQQMEHSPLKPVGLFRIGGLSERLVQVIEHQHPVRRHRLWPQESVDTIRGRQRHRLWVQHSRESGFPAFRWPNQTDKPIRPQGGSLSDFDGDAVAFCNHRASRRLLLRRHIQT